METLRVTAGDVSACARCEVTGLVSQGKIGDNNLARMRKVTSCYGQHRSLHPINGMKAYRAA
ncbi:hypothetical protein SAMN05443248_2680 [Bradyrhizobium erythrophlei]|uniref:Uncharacterized protein n=1 Tax=Bradyrhizobium erythrophlei TaxID=1437360 RepID=A0A1M5MQJ7_9BRAD|nr:hypothetical protein SAMN05443248_2680 [Bradyrhizobium erythrophlei]